MKNARRVERQTVDGPVYAWLWDGLSDEAVVALCDADGWISVDAMTPEIDCEHQSQEITVSTKTCAESGCYWEVGHGVSIFLDADDVEIEGVIGWQPLPQVMRVEG